MKCLLILVMFILMAGSPLLARPTHLWDAGPWPECSPGDTDQQKLDLKLAWARGFSEALKAADPQGEFFMSGWFLQGADWTPDVCRQFMHAMTAPAFIADLWFDKNPVYEKCDYFNGITEWGLGVVHTFGHVDSLHGNLQDLIDRVQKVTTDPKRGNLTGFYISPESIHHNFLYYDLVTQLAWNPKGVTLDGFLRSYCTRRYGEASAPEMAAAWKLVSETVYGDNDAANPTPTYQDPLPMGGGTPDSAFTDAVRHRATYIPKMRKALAMAEHAAVVIPPEEKKMPAKKYAIDLLDDCVICVPFEPSWMEQHAAEELQKYVEAMTGKMLPIRKRSTTKLTDGTNTIQLMTWGYSDRRDDEAFSVEAEDHHLNLIGNHPRTTLYAVYDFLEKECGCGFFEDGDHIPKHTTLRFGPIDRTEKPFFARRVAPSPCAYVYTAQYWGVDEWKIQLDYMAKRKLNTFYWTVGMSTVLYRTWKKLGYEVPEPTEWDYWGEQLQKEVRAYAEALDMDLVGQLWPGNVTPEFAQAHPEIEYLTFRWLDNPLGYVIHPSDPLFQKVMTTYVNEWQKTYGGVRIWDQSPWCETFSPWGEQPVSHVDAKLAWAKAYSKAIEKIGSGAKLFMSSWFMQSQQEWTVDVCQKFFAALKTDNFILADVWADKAPTYQRAGYMGGRGECLFGVIHTMGCVDHLHGNLLDLITRVKNVVDDERMTTLTGMYICAESFHHNFLYFDLATELAWDPTKVDLDDFLRRYCVRRYGRYGAEAMLKAWQVLTRTVYGDNTEANPTPSYQSPLVSIQQITDQFSEGFQDYTKRRIKLIPVVNYAHDLAVKHNDRLAENKFYVRDIIDIERTLLGLWFDFHAINCQTAFYLKDRGMFDENAKIMIHALNDIDHVISLDPSFYLEQEIEMASKRPKSQPPYEDVSNNAQEIRQRYTAAAGMARYPSLLDYSKADRVELVRGYYIPRVEAWIDHMRDCMDNGRSTSFSFLLYGAYKEITATFIETGMGHYTGPPASECNFVCPRCGGLLPALRRPVAGRTVRQRCPHCRQRLYVTKELEDNAIPSS